MQGQNNKEMSRVFSQLGSRKNIYWFNRQMSEGIIIHLNKYHKQFFVVIYWCYTWHQLNAHLLYSITIYMLHYNPQHVSSSTLLIFWRTNCIITASGIVTLCKRLYSMHLKRLQHVSISIRSSSGSSYIPY